MFGLMRNLYRWYTTRKEKVVKFALIGIDNAGKSTILARIKGEVPEFISPTVGFASESIDQGLYHIKIFDLGGGANIRTIWPSYFAEIHGAIFVVDSADKGRINVSRDALHAALQHPRLSKKPLLIFANKQDLPDAMQSHDVALQLALEKFSDYSYNIIDCTAILVGQDGAIDNNIKQGLKWLLDTVDRNFSSLEKRITLQVAEQKEEERIEKEEKRKRIEAMRRERELERERLEKEQTEQEKAKETGPPFEVSIPMTKSPSIELFSNDPTPSSPHPPPPPPIPPLGMAPEDLKGDPPHSSPRRPTPRSFSLTPRRLNSVAPAPPDTKTDPPDPPDHTATGSPRSAWSTLPPLSVSKRKLEPLTLPSPSLDSL